MCGIFSSNDPIVKQKHEKIISQHLNFRGPDYNSGLINFSNWKLYHSRLSIIAPNKKYNQPYLCDDGSMLLYNGEIFNFKELAKKLNYKKIISDTELLSKLIIKKNFDPNILDGFFSIIRISKDGKLLNCFRDPFGVKPLYYYQRGKYISITSEPSIFKKVFNLKISKDSLNEFKIFRSPIFSTSYYREVKSVKPGYCLVNNKYFDLLKEMKIRKNKKKLNLNKLLMKIIIKRQISDVPVAILLSSGVDSNLIKEMSPKISNYFCGGLKNDKEIQFLKNKYHKKNAINFTEVSSKSYIKRFRELIKLKGEPLSVPNEVVLSLIAKSAKQKGFKVLMSGEGADEFFAGYDRIFRWAANTKKFDINKFCELYCYDKINEKNLKKLKKFFLKLNHFNPFDKTKAFFLKFHLPILLRRLDFSLMSSGVEGREPFVSKELFYESIKYSSKDLLNKEVGKIPLRKTLSIYSNKEFSFREKIGFPIDLRKIFGFKKNIPISNYNIWYKENLKCLKKI